MGGGGWCVHTLLLAVTCTWSLSAVGTLLPPPGTTAKGCCGVTDSHPEPGACDELPKGSWNTKKFGIKSLADCARRCANCSQCAFVSYNSAPDSEDCSWYNEASCDLGGLLKLKGYDSEFVQAGRGPPPAPPVTVAVDWKDATVARTCTAATIEVDVMPFLSRDEWGGPFDGYYTALSNLGAEFVRFAPWNPDPRAVVLELAPSDCTKEKPSTNFNSTVSDAITRDFMAAVCGEAAVNGKCKKSVVQQISTMPSWLFKGGYCTDGSTSCLPAFPWNRTRSTAKYGGQGTELVDPTCGQMAKYIGRVVGWYTAGGFADECGHWHESGLHYKWWGLSILNENQHQINGNTIKCYDATVAEIKRINPDIVPVGPELVGDDPQQSALIRDFLNSSNHANKQAPPVVSIHLGSDSQDAFWSDWDGFLHGQQKCDDKTSECTGVIPWYESLKEAQTELVVNEFIPFISDWCDSGSCHGTGGDDGMGGDPNLADGNCVGMNRQTSSWNAAAAYFAYAFGTLTELRYKYVGVDQNEAAVSCLDWVTGEPNAKYWTVNLLAQTVGTSAEKTIYNHTVTSGSHIYALPFTINWTRGLLLVNKEEKAVEVNIAGSRGGSATVVEFNRVSAEPAIEPQIRKEISTNGVLALGPYAVAVVTELF